MLPNIQKILYATGLGAGAPYVFRYALSLAQQYGAKIAVVHGMEPVPAFAQSLVELHISHEQAEQIHQNARTAMVAKLEERLELLCEKELCSDGEGRSRVCAIVIEEGAPAEFILQQAQKLGVDLIVMGSHRHTVLGEALLGTTTHKVLHKSTIPVLVVRIPEGYREAGF
ncbi:MAG: universal stress protein [Trichloromonadaceae bacterium]